MRLGFERVVKLDDIFVVCQVLEDLHVLSHLLFTLYLLVEFLLLQALDCDEVTTQFMLSHAYFAKCAFSQLVSNAVELVRRSDRLAHLLEVRDDHRHQILLVLQQRIEDLSDLYLR